MLDLCRLLDRRQITQQKHDRLTGLAERDARTLAFTMHIVLGVAAIACAALALLPSSGTAIVLGIFLMRAGFIVSQYLPGAARVCQHLHHRWRSCSPAVCGLPAGAPH